MTELMSNMVLRDARASKKVKPGEINEERKRHDKAPPVPLGDAARNVIVQLADPTTQVPDHVHWTCAHVISIVIDHGLAKIQSH